MSEERFTATFTGEATAELDTLCEKMKLENRAQVIRRSVKVMSLVMKAIEEGGRLWLCSIGFVV